MDSSRYKTAGSSCFALELAAERFLNVLRRGVIVLCELCQRIARFESISQNCGWNGAPRQNRPAKGNSRIDHHGGRLVSDVVLTSKQEQSNRDALSIPFDSPQVIANYIGHLCLAFSSYVDQ